MSLEHTLQMPKYEYQKDSSIGGNANLSSVGTKYPISDYVDTIRAKTFEAEVLMKAMPQIELKVIHHFSKDIYARELIIPAGVTLVGEIHKFENLNILSQGSMLVSTEKGVIQVDAPFTVVSPAGTKRIAHTLTECIWTTIHGTDEKDVDLIKDHFIAANEREWLEFADSAQLELGLD